MQIPIVVTEGAQGVDWFNAGSGLVGVLLGGALTYFVTYQFERKRLRAERLARSFSLFFRVMNIADDLTKMEIDIRDKLSGDDASDDEKREIWSRLETSVGHPDPITIPSEDLTVLALTRDQRLTTEVGEVEAAHRIYLALSHALESQKEKFESFELQSSVSLDDGIVSFVATGEEIPRIAPTLIRLRSLSKQLCEGLPRAGEQARSVAERLGPHLKRSYGFDHFVEMTFPRNEAGQVIAAYDLPSPPAEQSPPVVGRGKRIVSWLRFLIRM